MSFLTPSSPALPAISLAVSAIFVTHLTVLCHTAPNPSPKDRNVPDHVEILLSLFLAARRNFILGFGVYHAIVTLYYPQLYTAICPNPENLNARLFTWNIEAIGLRSMILIAAPIRLMAYKQLGPNFTFHLATPGKLITTGLYGWVQHPSYTAQFVVVIAHSMLTERKGGVTGCWLPAWFLLSPKINVLVTTGYSIGTACTAYALSIRVRDEEAMLKKAFGEEWEVYNKKTKRFIPSFYEWWVRCSYRFI